jgi:hypothetical protein
MKSKFLAIFAAIFATVSFSACDPGTAEYGYAYNPKGVLYKVFTDLQNNDFSDDWMILFSGKMTCYYTSHAGISKLKKTIGNMDTALDRFTLEQPVLVQTGKNIKGYQDVMGTIIKGERYQARVIRNSDHKVFFTAMISCFKENSGGADHQYCMITDLKNHILGNPVVPVCEDLK